jgi:hypothetical protein
LSILSYFTFIVNRRNVDSCYVRVQAEAQGAPGAAQAGPQPGAAVRVRRVPQGLQAPRAPQPAHRHPLRRQDRALRRMRQGYVPTYKLVINMAV